MKKTFAFRMRRFNTKTISIITLICFFISGCTAMTKISSPQSNVSLRIDEKKYSSMPLDDSFGVTTFGNYLFVAEKEGYEPVYGELPMDLKISYLVLDILFFTPLMLLNLYSVFPNYEIDIDKKIIRYSYDKTQWWELQIPIKESEKAKEYFKKADKQDNKPVADNKTVTDNKSIAEITSSPKIESNN